MKIRCVRAEVRVNYFVVSMHENIRRMCATSKCLFTQWAWSYTVFICINQHNREQVRRDYAECAQMHATREHFEMPISILQYEYALYCSNGMLCCAKIFTSVVDFTCSLTRSLVRWFVCSYAFGSVLIFTK